MDYELHVTVPPAEATALNLLKSPPFRILTFENWDVGTDVMTSETFEAPDLKVAMTVGRNRVRQLEDEDLNPVRWKLERAPDHHLSLGGYWETHMEYVGVFRSELQPPGIRAMVSDSALKHYLTFRDRSPTFSVHRMYVDRWVSEVGGIHILSVDHEMVVFDSNPEWDQKWEAASCT